MTDQEEFEKWLLKYSKSIENQMTGWSVTVNRDWHACAKQKNAIIDQQAKEIKALREVVMAMRDWIDAVPEDTQLPSMPGFDRDWADSVIDGHIVEGEK